MARHWDDAAGVVTPEAVTLQFREANVGSRFIAFLLDWMIIWTAATFVFAAAGMVEAASQGRPPTWVMVLILGVGNLGLFFGYPIAMETLTRGRTVGKMAMGLRAVTVEGAPIGFRHAAIRAAVGMVDFYMTVGIAATASILFSRRHQRLGDRVAGTVVVRERAVSLRPVALQFDIPPWAQRYAATVDPSGMTTREYDTVREFLQRAYMLSPDSRDRLGRRLAGVLAAKLGHAPPPDVSPELFLVTLVSRFQQRQWTPPPVPVAEASEPPAPEPSPERPPADWGDFRAPGP